MQTKLHELGSFGQSIWLDYISRPLLETGKLHKLIESGLRGMTSNPSIFNQAISQSHDYDEKIIQLNEAGKSSFEIYDDLTIKDVQDAADIFKRVYDQTNGLDGYVSLEINPKLAMDSYASIEEGKRLFKKVNRPNVMIKVPSTSAGFPVIEELLAAGIPVNVTLIFSLEQYINTVWAYFKGLKRLGEQKGNLANVKSVASVFVSRVDTAVDKLLDEKIKATLDTDLKAKLSALKSKAAVANCGMIFEKFKNMFKSDLFNALVQQQASEQRVLWASTGTKNPDLSDIKYVTELVGRPTVNTLPEKTLNAVLDHGIVTEALGKNNFDRSQNVLDGLKEAGIDINAVCSQLLKEGVEAFEKSFDELLTSIEEKSQKLARLQ